MGTSTASGSSGSSEQRWGKGTTVDRHYNRNKVKADPHYIPKGNNFSTKYEEGKPLPAGDKNSGSYWQNLVSTDGGKTLHTQKAARLAKEHGYNSPAYTLDHLHERQKAGISDLDPAGFNPNFYKGSSWKGKKGKTHTIPSDQDTIKAIPKLLGKFVPGSLLSENKRRRAISGKVWGSPKFKDKRFFMASRNPNKKTSNTSLKSNNQRRSLLG